MNYENQEENIINAGYERESSYGEKIVKKEDIKIMKDLTGKQWLEISENVRKEQGFYYYVFELNGEKRYYYTTVILSDESEILDWSENYGFIDKEDISNCNNAREVSLEEVKMIENELYKEWWKEREEKRLRGEDVGNIPPHIGVQLN